MKKTMRFWTAVAVATLTAVGFVAEPTPSFAQISFGKMREATEKGKKPSAPIVDEDADAFDVDPNEKADAKTSKNEKKAEKPASSPASGRTIGRRSSVAGGNAARTTRPATTRTNAARPAAQPTPAVDAEKPTDDADLFGTPETDAPTRTAVETPNAPEATPETVEKTKSDDASNDGKRGPLLGKAISTKYRAGMIFEARPNGGCKDLLGTAPVPTDFPEQKVRTLEENFPRVARVDYRDLKEGGARQMVFRMRELKPGQRVEATVLFEVTRRPLLPPSEPEIYKIPKTVPRELRRYLKSGDYIESTSKTVRKLAAEIVEKVEKANKDASDWEKVDALFEYVRTEISYKEAQVEKPMRGALAALRTRDGDCEDMSALFIAMCRSLDIPARLVRVPGHCWAEFYLVDDEKEGYWFPAQVAGTEELGSMQDVRVILQKGDSFRLPESPGEDSLYVKELFTGNVKENAPDPIYQFIQDTNPTD
ncbi:MAG: transglutaminase domain-containing protein [Thermoguttaceae bacterium]|nr:transglutaminase domain-containing protein [Thermoguttaceae bacterium]